METKDSFKKKIKKKHDSNDKENHTVKNFLFTTLVKCLIVVVVFLSCLIFIRQNDKNKESFNKIVYQNSLSFARIYDFYHKHLGDLIPFKNVKSDDTKVVSDEKISYTSIKEYKDGYELEVPSMYPVPVVKAGIVIEQKKDDVYGNIIKIQDKDGLVITYGNLNSVDVKLYDYVERSEIIATADKKLYLIFSKNGEKQSYEKYL